MVTSSRAKGSTLPGIGSPGSRLGKRRQQAGFLTPIQQPRVRSDIMLQSKNNLARFENYDPYAPANTLLQWCPPKPMKRPPRTGGPKACTRGPSSLGGRGECLVGRPVSTSVGHRTRVGGPRIERKACKRLDASRTRTADPRLQQTINAAEAVAACRMSRSAQNSNRRAMTPKEIFLAPQRDKGELAKMLATLDKQRDEIVVMIEHQQLGAAIKIQSLQRKRVAKQRVDERRDQMNDAACVVRLPRPCLLTAHLCMLAGAASVSRAHQSMYCK